MSKTGGRYEPIEFFENTITTNTSGTRSAVEVSYWVTRAKVKPLSERRGLEAYQVILTQGYEFSIKYRSDKTVLKNMKLTWNGLNLIIHEIHNVNNLNKEVRVVAMVSE